MRPRLEVETFRRYYEALTQRPAMLDYPPLDVYIEITNACNLKCKMCPHNGLMSRHKGYMDKNMFFHLIDTLHGYVKHIRMFMMGEPLLHPDFLDMLAYAKNRGMTVLIDSNCALLDEPISRGIVELGLDTLRISLDAVNREQYLAIKGRDCFDQVLDKLRGLLRTKQSMGSDKPYTILQMIRLPENAPAWNTFENTYALDGFDKIEVVQYLNFAERASGINGNGCVAHRAESLCVQPWRHLVVLRDGRVTPCCQDYDGVLSIGTLDDGSLIELWNNERLREIRSQLADGNFAGQLEFCRFCNVLYSNNHDSTKVDPSYILIYELCEPYRALISPEVFRQIELERRKFSPF